MRRQEWPGALRVTIVAVAVMLVWTAWVIQRVRLPAAPGGRTTVLQTIEQRDCPHDRPAGTDV